MGFGLYKKCGFQEIGGPDGVVEVDMGEWGGEGVHRHVAMIRFSNGSGGHPANNAPR